jgi:hypothetical protein
MKKQKVLANSRLISVVGISFLLVSGNVFSQTATYPGKIATDQQLGVAGNGVFGSMRAQQAIGDNTLVLANGTCTFAGINTACNVAFKPAMFIVVDNEVEQVCSITVSGSNTILNLGIEGSPCPSTQGRGLDGSQVSAHNNLSTRVNNDIVAWNHNATVKEVQAIEKSSSITLNMQGAGADPSGVKDSSSVINTTAAANSIGGRLFFPCGKYRLNSQIKISGYHTIFEGQSNGCVEFDWYGPSTGPALFDADCFACLFRDFDIHTKAGYPLQYGLQTSNTGGDYIATRNIFQRISIWGIDESSSDNTILLTTGVYLGGPVHVNNDQQRFEAVLVYYYIHSAWTLADFNVLQVVMFHCGFDGWGGLYGVENIHGSFSWISSDGARNSGADFIFSPGSQFTHIQDSEFEASTKFMITGYIGANSPMVQLDSVVFGGECVGANVAQIQNGCSGYTPTGDFIVWGLLGSLRVSNSTFGTKADGKITINLAQATAVTGPAIGFEDNAFTTAAITTATLFTGSKPARFIGNAYIDSAGANYLYPDEYNVPINFNAAVTFGVAPVSPPPMKQTYTPQLNFGSGTNGANYTNTVGAYYVVTGVTYFYAQMTLSGLTGATGAAYVTTPTNVTSIGAATVYLNGCIGISLPVLPLPYAVSNQFELDIQNPTFRSSLNNTNFQAGCEVLMFGWYI